eukprot:361544-Chlamydomonas_euryale.AAC.1
MPKIVQHAPTGKSTTSPRLCSASGMTWISARARMTPAAKDRNRSVAGCIGLLSCCIAQQAKSIGFQRRSAQPRHTH